MEQDLKGLWVLSWLVLLAVEGARRLQGRTPGVLGQKYRLFFLFDGAGGATSTRLFACLSLQDRFSRTPQTHMYYSPLLYYPYLCGPLVVHWTSNFRFFQISSQSRL